MRPLLLAGLPPRQDVASGDLMPDDFTSPQRRAAAFIGAAMEQLLPAVDANDEEKLLAALTFYNAVFSAVTGLRGAESAGLPEDGAAAASGELAAMDTSAGGGQACCPHSRPSCSDKFGWVDTPSLLGDTEYLTVSQQRAP